MVRDIWSADAKLELVFYDDGQWRRWIGKAESSSLGTDELDLLGRRRETLRVIRS